MVKNVLITGGLGYVGGRIAQHLLDAGHYQITVTSRRDVAPPLPGISLLKIDDAKETYDSYLEGIDVVIHLAAMNEIDCVKHPFQAIEVNVMQTLKWIKAAERASCSQFIYFSTIHVYGSPLIGHIDEAQPTRPTHPYSITHKAAEDYVLASRDRTSLDAIVLRLSNSFGRPLSTDI